MSTSLQLTWSGSESLFAKCKDIILQRLQEDILWKRSESMLPYHTKLTADFVMLTPGIIKLSNATGLGTLPAVPPLCHFYFSEVPDAEGSVANLRSTISEWLIRWHSSDCTNCILVFDSGRMKESKTKTSIIDRLKSDYPKLSNRMLQINLSHKKGIPLLLRYVIELLQQSLDKLVNFYDFALKNDRDNCMRNDWNFTAYFINQMQLSQLYICLSMFDQALVPVEEVDATLSLLVAHYADTHEKPDWLRTLFVSAQNAVHTSLKWLLDNKVQELNQLYQSVSSDNPGNFTLNHEKIRLLLFVCHLDILMIKHGWTISLCEKGKNESCELLLDLGFKTLERLSEENALTKKENDYQGAVKNFKRLLWHEELLTLASDCGDLYNIHNSIESLCQICIALCQEAETIRNNFECNPVALNQIKQSFHTLKTPVMAAMDYLNSLEAFHKQYVKWYEFALALLKHKSWNNSADILSLNLARFYCYQKDYAASAAFYAKILRSLRCKRWEHLFNMTADESMLSNSASNQLLPHFTPFDKFAFLCDLSCCNWSSKQRAFELLQASINKSANSAEISLKCSPVWFSTENLSCEPVSAIYGSTFALSVDLISQFNDSLTPSSVYLCLKRYRTESNFACESGEKLIFDEIVSTKSTDFVALNDKAYFGCSKRKSGEFLDCQASSRCPNSAHFECVNVEVVRIDHGLNRIKVFVKPLSSGVFCVDHLHLNFTSLCICLPLRFNSSNVFLSFVVDSVDFSVLLEPCHPDGKLWTGVTQSLRLTFESGTDDTWDENGENQIYSLVVSSPDKSIYFVGNPESALFTKTVTFERISYDVTKQQRIIDVFVALDGKTESRHCTLLVEYREWKKEFVFRFDTLLSWQFETRWIGSKILLIEFSLTNHASDFDTKIMRAELEMTKCSSDFDATKSVESQDAADSARQNSTVHGILLNKSSMIVTSGSSFNIVWRVDNENFEKGLVYFLYSCPGNTETFECWASFLFVNFPIIEVNCHIASESTVCRVDMPCDFVVSLKADDKQLRCAELNVRLCLTTLEDDEKKSFGARKMHGVPCFWQPACQSSILGSNSQPTTHCHVTLKENGLGQAFFRLTPCQVGYLPCPYVELDVLTPAALTGQCRTYVRSKGKQIHVLAPLPRTKIDHASKNKTLIA